MRVTPSGCPHSTHPFRDLRGPLSQELLGESWLTGAHSPLSGSVQPWGSEGLMRLRLHTTLQHSPGWALLGQRGAGVLSLPGSWAMLGCHSQKKLCPGPKGTEGMPVMGRSSLPTQHSPPVLSTRPAHLRTKAGLGALSKGGLVQWSLPGGPSFQNKGIPGTLTFSFLLPSFSSSFSSTLSPTPPSLLTGPWSVPPHRGS